MYSAPPLFKMVIRKQVVIDYRNRKKFPYFTSLRVMTLNPDVNMATLRSIAIKKARDIELTYDLGSFQKQVAFEDKQILKKEEPLINTKDVYFQLQFRGDILNFEVIK